MAFDLLLKGGHLIDPKNGIDAPRDLAIAADNDGVTLPHRENCCAFELFHQWEMGIFRLYFKVSVIWEF